MGRRPAAPSNMAVAVRRPRPPRRPARRRTASARTATRRASNAATRQPARTVHGPRSPGNARRPAPPPTARARRRTWAWRAPSPTSFAPTLRVSSANAWGSPRAPRGFAMYRRAACKAAVRPRPRTRAPYAPCRETRARTRVGPSLPMASRRRARRPASGSGRSRPAHRTTTTAAGQSRNEAATASVLPK